MQNKLFILLLSIVILILSGCIDSHELKRPDVTAIATPDLMPSPAGKKLPLYSETKPVEISVFFETWSRGYYSNLTYENPYFRVISNYDEWRAFLEEQGYSDYLVRGGSYRLDGIIFPGQGVAPKTIMSTDFNDYFIIATMMGRIGRAEGPNIEIINITKTNNIINVEVRRVYGYGALTYSSPYHIVMIKRELLPLGNSTFNFIDTEGNLLGKLEVNV